MSTIGDVTVDEEAKNTELRRSPANPWAAFYGVKGKAMNRRNIALGVISLALTIVSFHPAFAQSPPVPVSLSPSTGLGYAATLTGVFNDPAGAADWYRVSMILGSQATNIGQCYVYYTVKAKSLYLVNDPGTANLGPIQSGVPTSNSKCTVTGYSASSSGSSITLTVSFTFPSTEQADFNVWLGAFGNDNLFSGWIMLGTWSTYSHLCSSPTTYLTNDVYLDYGTQTNMTKSSVIQLDANGVPMELIGAAYQYNPATIAQYGLQQWSYYKIYGTASYLANAIKMADWLVANQDSATGEWLYSFPINTGISTLNPPFGSSMSQGQAMSLLVRAYLATSNSKYLAAAEAATTSFTKPVSSGVGGLVDYFQGNPIYEGYPSTPPTHFLNAFMYSLIGLYDLSSYDSTADQLYTQGIQSLDFILPYYDLGDISSYFLGHETKPPHHPFVSQEYHRYHVADLRALETVNGSDAIIRYYAINWCSDMVNGLPTQ